MALDPETKRRLDEAASKARVEFEAGWTNWKAVDVAEWWWRWCHMGGTNHDRLGRILLEVTGVRQKHMTGVSWEEDSN